MDEKSKYNRLKFDYRFDKIIDFLYTLDPKVLIKFLKTIHLFLLESSKRTYFTSHLDVESSLLSSSDYNNGLRYIDSEDEKSIDYYLLNYYKKCSRAELKAFFEENKESNYVVLLISLMKLLGDRSNEFVEEIVELMKIIVLKNGLKAVDDFFQLTIIRLIVKSVPYFNEQQFIWIRSVILDITHPYEVWIHEYGGKKNYRLNIGRKKYLFIKALPLEALTRDPSEKGIPNVEKALW